MRYGSEIKMVRDALEQGSLFDLHRCPIHMFNLNCAAFLIRSRLKARILQVPDHSISRRLEGAAVRAAVLAKNAA
jgi:hypothetical protein